MIVYIYISKVKNIKIPLTNLLLIRKFYMIQLNRICQPSKKNNWKLGFLWHKLKRKGLFIYLINRLYKRFNKLDSHNVYYILLYIFYNRCHVINKSRMITSCPPLSEKLCILHNIEKKTDVFWVFTSIGNSLIFLHLCTYNILFITVYVLIHLKSISQLWNLTKYRE